MTLVTFLNEQGWLFLASLCFMTVIVTAVIVVMEVIG
jgi:hypothetical protein